MSVTEIAWSDPCSRALGMRPNPFGGLNHSEPPRSRPISAVKRAAGTPADGRATDGAALRERGTPPGVTASKLPHGCWSGTGISGRLRETIRLRQSEGGVAGGAPAGDGSNLLSGDDLLHHGHSRRAARGHPEDRREDDEGRRTPGGKSHCGERSGGAFSDAPCGQADVPRERLRHPAYKSPLICAIGPEVARVNGPQTDGRAAWSRVVKPRLTG